MPASTRMTPRLSTITRELSYCSNLASKISASFILCLLAAKTTSQLCIMSWRLLVLQLTLLKNCRDNFDETEKLFGYI